MRTTLLFVLLMLSPLTYADIDGNPVVSATTCNADLFSAASVVCKLFAAFGPAATCNVKLNNCAVGTQEIFTGNEIELASPTNIKNWTGFGAMGPIYQAADLCLLRDMKDVAIESEAPATTAIGDVSIHQTVQFLSFDKTKLEWQGYHRGRACAPAIGCMDMFNQKITVRAVTSNLKGSGAKAGEYDIYGASALEVVADGISQSFEVSVPAINVPTPYGLISATPAFGMGRGMGYVLAPYQGGNVKTAVAGPWGTAKMIDLYGRNPGTARTETYPSYFVFGSGVQDNRAIGYISQAAFGSRSADPKAAVWAPPAGVEYPVTRPDGNIAAARSDLEKIPNAYLGANVKVEYSPTNMIPAYIRKNKFISLTFGVWAKPMIDTAFTSQFNISNYEIAKGNKLALPAGPLDYHPQNMDQFKGAALFGGTTAAARFALDAGVDLTIHLHVPLFITDINVDLIDIHPLTTIAEKISTGKGAAKPTAFANSHAAEILSTGKYFQSYQTLNGSTTDGAAHIKACLAAPNASAPPPPAPSYTPGDLSDLLKDVEYPCNICVGMNDYTYKAKDGTMQTIKGFLENLFAADESTRPAGVRWTCDQVYESGCYDMCTWNQKTNVLTVTRTAREMLASGEAKKMPARCR